MRWFSKEALRREWVKRQKTERELESHCEALTNEKQQQNCRLFLTHLSYLPHFCSFLDQMTDEEEQFNPEGVSPLNTDRTPEPPASTPGR